MSRFSTASFVALAAGALLSVQARATRKYLSPDFFIDTEAPLTARSFSNTPTPLTLAECRASIRPKMCLVDPQPEGESGPRPCLAGGEAYAPQLEALFDTYPAALQRVFCSINRIFVEKDSVGTAYAGSGTYAPGKFGTIMGIRQSVLDERLTLSHWASWKEQLAFGANPKSFELLEGKPIVTASLKDSNVHDFLYFVIAHEFGHILDFANGANQFECGAAEATTHLHRDCIPTGQWSKLDWQDSLTPLEGKNYSFRDDFCFYWCNGHFPGLAHMGEMYRNLWNTTFLSSYASKNAYDDLAETMAYVVATDEQDLHFELNIEGTTYDSVAKLFLPRLDEKREWMREFLKRPHLYYPN